MISKVEFKDKKLIIESSNGVFIKDFNLGIAEVVVHMNKILVLLKLVRGNKENRNIFCINENGDTVWQIKDPDDYNPYVDKSDAAFTGIRISPDGKLLANNWNSSVYEVDINTGNLSNPRWTK